MTVARGVRSLAAPNLEAALTALRARGLRISAARRLVLEALFAARAPVTAESIAAGLGGRLPPSDLASVYRNLDVLEQQGFVRHLHLGHGAGLYALAGVGPYEYLACERCGEYEAVPPGELDAARDAIRRAFGYAASWTHFPVVGLCEHCVQANSSDRGPALFRRRALM
jgi:Fur family ferric uptake transcriptional regulator